MPREIFTHLIIIKEASIGKKKLMLRYEIPKKGMLQYCIRDSKFKALYKTTYRPHAEQCFAEYLKLLENPCNPFKPGDIIYEKRDKGKTTKDYDFFQVIKIGASKVFLQKLTVECKPSFVNTATYLTPLRDKFASTEIIEKKIEIVTTGDYGTIASYSIHSENGIYEKLKHDSVYVSQL